MFARNQEDDDDDGDHAIKASDRSERGGLPRGYQGRRIYTAHSSGGVDASYTTNMPKRRILACMSNDHYCKSCCYCLCRTYMTYTIGPRDSLCGEEKPFRGRKEAIAREAAPERRS